MSGAVILLMAHNKPVSNELDPYVIGGVACFLLGLTVLAIIGAFSKGLKRHTRNHCVVFASLLGVSFIITAVAFAFSLK